MGDKAIISEILEASHLTESYRDLAAPKFLDELVGGGGGTAAKKKEAPGVRYEPFGEAAAASGGDAAGGGRVDFGSIVAPKKELEVAASRRSRHGAMVDEIGPFRVGAGDSDSDDDEEDRLRYTSDDDQSGLFPLLPSTSTSLAAEAQDTFTVDQAVDALGFGPFQIKLSILTGLAWMADAMEMMILSILSPALHCEWWLPSYQQALITTVVFCGMMLSSTMWGNICDKYGRKTGLVLSTLITFFFGVLSALSPSFTWLLILRGLTGFGIGGVPQSVTLYAEFLPSAHRAKCVVMIEAFWAIGALFESILAYFVMESLGWRWLLVISSVPLLIFTSCCYWLPESARYQVACGDTDRAYETLQRVATENGKPMLLGRLVDAQKKNGEDAQRGRIVDLFVPELRITTILMWFIWMANAFCYYGIVLFTTEIFQSGDECHGGAGKVEQAACPLECHRLTQKDYVDLFYTTLAELPGVIVTAAIIEVLGRKKTMAIEFLVFSFFVFLLFGCLGRLTVTIFIFVARASISGAFQAAYVYTPEVYPTTLRAIGLGTCSGMARLGAIVTPFIAQVASDTSMNIPIAVYGIVSVFGCFASLILPIETKGRVMKDTH